MLFSKPVGRLLFFACFCLFTTITQASGFSNSIAFHVKDTVIKEKLPDASTNILNFFFEEEDVNEGEDELVAEFLDFSSNSFFSFFSNLTTGNVRTQKALDLSISRSKPPIFILIRNLRI